MWLKLFEYIGINVLKKLSFKIQLNKTSQTRTKKAIFWNLYTLYICKRYLNREIEIMTATYDAIERNKKPAGALEIPEDFHFYYLNKKDRQMRFNNGGDPIYAIFDKIDERPLSKIAKDFVRELADDSIRFISTLIK